jgi:hypothetical protein
MKKMRNQKPGRTTWQIKKYVEKANNREDVSRPKSEDSDKLKGTYQKPKIEETRSVLT